MTYFISFSKCLLIEYGNGNEVCINFTCKNLPSFLINPNYLQIILVFYNDNHVILHIIIVFHTLQTECVLKMVMADTSD